MRIKVLLFSVVFYLLGGSTHAQFILSKQYTLNEGLISNDINKVFIASDNNLWLASSIGLLNKEVNLFVENPLSKALEFTNVFDVTQDSKGGIWSVSYGQGVLYLDGQQAKILDTQQGLVSNKARSVFYFNDHIYVGTQNGVSIISIDDFSITNPSFIQDSEYYFEVSDFFMSNNQVYATTINDGVYLVNNDKLIKVSDTKKILSCFSDDQFIYLGTTEELIKIHKKDFSLAQRYPLGNVRDFVQVNDQIYLLTCGTYQSQAGVYSIFEGKIFNLQQQLSLPITGLSSIAIDPLNFLYISSKTEGLFQIDLDAPIQHNKQAGLVYSMVNIQDQMYVFDTKGLSVFRNKELVRQINLDAFKDFQTKNQHVFANKATIENHFFPIDYSTSPEHIVFYNAKVHHQSVWVSSNIGLFEISSQTNQIKNYYPIHSYVFDFFRDSLVTAVPYGGIRIFTNLATFDYLYYHHWDNKQGVEIAHIPSEIVDIAVSQNAIYFATALKGVFQFKRGKFTSWVNRGILDQKYISKIDLNDNGELIVATDYGDIYSIDITQPTLEITQKDDYPIISSSRVMGNEIRFLQQSGDYLFVATNLGLNVYKDDKHFFLDKEQGLSDNNITCGLEIDNSLYLGSHHGFYEVNRDFFTSFKGVDLNVFITEVLANEKALTLRDNKELPVDISLNSNQNNIRIDFGTHRFKYPQKIFFKYRLKPTEPWRDLTRHNSIEVFYLSADYYPIQIQWIDLSTGQIKVVDLLNLTIKPPFYKTTWFAITAGVLFILFWVVFYKVRVAVLTNKQNKQLVYITQKNQDQERQLLLEKRLADVKLQALQSQMNSHFLFNVLSSIQFFIISNDVDKALYYIERFASLIRTTLTYSDVKEVSLQQEITYLENYLEIENIRVNNQIVFSVQSEPSIDLRSILITPMLLQPFVENSVVHAFDKSIDNPTITLEVKEKDKAYLLILKDNGVGFSNKQKSSHVSKGISIIQKRLELTNNKDSLRIISDITGTRVEINLVKK